jgi:hypothetical protein
MGDLQGQQASLQAEQDELTVASQRLQAQVEAFRTRKETIKAAYTAAEAQTRTREAVTGISEEMGDVGMAVQRAQGKTAPRGFWSRSGCYGRAGQRGDESEHAGVSGRTLLSEGYLLECTGRPVNRLQLRVARRLLRVRGGRRLTRWAPRSNGGRMVWSDRVARPVSDVAASREWRRERGPRMADRESRAQRGQQPACPLTGPDAAAGPLVASAANPALFHGRIR